MVVCLSFFQYAGALEPEQSPYMPMEEERVYEAARHEGALERVQAKEAPPEMVAALEEREVRVSSDSVIEILPLEAQDISPLAGGGEGAVPCAVIVAEAKGNALEQQIVTGLTAVEGNGYQQGTHWRSARPTRRLLSR